MRPCPHSSGGPKSRGAPSSKTSTYCSVNCHDAIARFLHLHVAVVTHASTRHRAPQALVGLERGASCFSNPVVPDDEGLTLLPYTGDDCLTYEGEINKMAVNVAFGRYTKTARFHLEDLEQTVLSFGMTSYWAHLARRLSVPRAWARPPCITAPKRYSNVVLFYVVW